MTAAPRRRAGGTRAPRVAAAGEDSTNPQNSKAVQSAAVAVRDYETVALVLQGGGALGAYQCGVYEGLEEAGVRPDWFAGISIGAINAAILAGNAPERRLDRLREFWQRISTPALPLPPEVFDWQRQWLDALPKCGTAQSADRIRSAPGPRCCTARAASSCRACRRRMRRCRARRARPASTAPRRCGRRSRHWSISSASTIRHHRASRSARSTCATATLPTSTTARQPSASSTSLASAALPPAFAAVEIDGEFYWDGGLVSNTPLEYVIESTPRSDTLALQVDLWGARGALPRTLGDVLERQKDIQYSSRTRRGTDSSAEKQRLRLALGELVAMLPANACRPHWRTPSTHWICTKVLNIVHLIYQAKSYEEQYKDYAFGPQTMCEHWAAGLADMRRTLARPQCLARPAPEVGVATHDIHR